MRLSTPRTKELTYTDGETFTRARIDDFPEDTFRELLDRDPAVDDTRSQVLQFRLPNGDLLLGFFPQGNSYFEIEGLFTT